MGARLNSAPTCRLTGEPLNGESDTGPEDKGPLKVPEVIVGENAEASISIPVTESTTLKDVVETIVTMNCRLRRTAPITACAGLVKVNYTSSPVFQFTVLGMLKTAGLALVMPVIT